MECGREGGGGESTAGGQPRPHPSAPVPEHGEDRGSGAGRAERAGRQWGRWSLGEGGRERNRKRSRRLGAIQSNPIQTRTSNHTFAV